MKRIALVLALLFCLVGVGMWIQGLLLSEEDRVRNVIHRAMEKIEQRAPLGVAGCLHPKYRDVWRLDTQRVKRVMLWMRQEFEELRVTYSDIDVTVDGQTATATFQARAEARTGRGWKFLDETLSQLSDQSYLLKLTQHEGEWKIIWAGHSSPP